MGFKVTYKGLEVIVDTLDDLDVLADRASKGKTNGHVSRSPGLSHSKQNLPLIKDFVAGLGENAKLGLKVLLEHGGKMRDREFCRALGVSDNLALGGRVVSPIHRAANKVGLKGEQVIQKTLISEKPRVFEYSVSSDAADEIRKGLEV